MTQKPNKKTEKNLLGIEFAHFEKQMVNLNRYIEKNDTFDRKIVIDKNNMKEYKSKNKDFVFEQPYESEILKGRITREKNGINPVYYYEHETFGLEYHKVLMAEEKQNEILIYDIRNDDVTEIAKIKMNLLGSVYKLLVKEQEKWVFKYESSLDCFKSPKKFTIIGHSLRYNIYHRKCKKALSKMIKNEEWENLLIFVNKPPQYNSNARMFMLNLQERDMMNPSVKNFQIIDFFDTKEPIMTFAKHTSDVFILEFTFPLAIVDAFFFAICSIDNKGWIY